MTVTADDLCRVVPVVNRGPAVTLHASHCDPEIYWQPSLRFGLPHAAGDNFLGRLNKGFAKSKVRAASMGLFLAHKQALGLFVAQMIAPGPSST